jgi:quercetin dioxygenase-like cupin family protein
VPSRPRALSFTAALSSLLLVLGLAVPASAIENDTSATSTDQVRAGQADQRTRGRAAFSVYHGHAPITLVDASSDGHQLGDLRVTSIPTTTEDGTPLGRLDATLTTTAIDTPKAGDEIRISSLIFAFGADGQSQIVVGGTAVYPAEGPTIALDAVTTRPILGGSGRFAGASGTAVTEHFGDDTWVHTFTLQRTALSARVGIRRAAPDHARGLRVRLREGLRLFDAERRESRGQAADGYGADQNDNDKKTKDAKKPKAPREEAFPELKSAEETAKAAYEEAKSAYRAANKEARVVSKAANKEARDAAKAAKKAEKEASADDGEAVTIVEEPDEADSPPAEVGITRIDLGVARPGTAPGEQLGLWQYSIPAGSELVPHTHPGWQIAYIARGPLTYNVIEGEGTIIGSDGSSTQIGPGEYILETGDSVVENPELVHQGANRGDGEVVIIASTLYEQGAPLAIPVEEPAEEEPAA